MYRNVQTYTHSLKWQSKNESRIHGKKGALPHLINLIIPRSLIKPGDSFYPVFLLTKVKHYYLMTFFQVVAFVCGYLHYNFQSSPNQKLSNFQPWNINM
jgi:hypothetical protein